MMSNFLGLVVGVVGAAATWVVLNFFGNPVREFFSLRRDVHRQMLLYDNVSGPLSNVAFPFPAASRPIPKSRGRKKRGTNSAIWLRGFYLLEQASRLLPGSLSYLAMI
jgi:hypothetical protein